MAKELIKSWVPKPHIDNKSAIADYAEIRCFSSADFNTSIADVVRVLGRESNLGEDAITGHVEDAFDELSDRVLDMGEHSHRYPFSLDDTGSLLQLEKTAERSDQLLYAFLLLATRLNMKSQKVQAGLDGTALFEQLSCEVGKSYWGGGDDKRLGNAVFGTGRHSNDEDDDDIDLTSFERKIVSLCRMLREGVGYDPKVATNVKKKDDKLDIVIWREFSDRRAGKLIGFGQCKTGTNWHTSIGLLRPEAFCAKWMRTPFAVMPQRLFFIADRIQKDKWNDTCFESGIMFDRCRMLEYAQKIPSDLLSKIEKWVLAAFFAGGMQLP